MENHSDPGAEHPSAAIKSQVQSDQNRTLTRKPNYFEARVLFLRQPLGVYFRPRSGTAKHSPRTQGPYGSALNLAGG